MSNDSISPADWALLERYFLGRADSGDAEAVRRLLARDPRLATLAAALRTTPPTDEQPFVDLVALKHRIVARRDDLVTASPVRRDVRRVVPWWTSRPWIVGGALVVLATAAFGVRYRMNTRHGPIQTYATGVGQQATFRLADGTRVTLAPKTTLRASSFDTRTRDVVLDGEAYFEVSHTGGVPFIVNTGATRTRVLGTAFLVQHYAGDAHVRVAVVTGKVAVTVMPVRRTLILSAGAVGDATDSTAVVRTGDVAAERVQWMTGRLVFRDVPTADILAALTRWYGYEFRLADSTLAGEKLTAGVSTQSSRDALATLAAVLDAELTFDGNVITIHTRPSVSRPPVRARRLPPLSSPLSEVGR